MTSFWSLLRRNRNYRYAWLGQVVSEVGDHFNTVAVMSLSLHVTGSPAGAGATMLARTVPALAAAPYAGVFLDRMDRKHVMIASDIARAVIAAAFILLMRYREPWLLYTLSGMLAFASPFFSSGRMAILPRITDPEELHTANALTQTTAWLTLTLGAMLGGISTTQFGYEWAFVVNSLSFLFSGFAIWKLHSPTGHFRATVSEVQVHAAQRGHFWADFTQSLHYMRRTPLVMAIGFGVVGWASGGGAAQILFTIFGEIVYNRGPAGIGLIWGFAGIGLVLGGLIGLQLGKRLTYAQYLHAVWIAFLIHGLGYVLFSVSNLGAALLCIMVSRAAMGANNVQNRTMLLRHVPDELRGRVFSAMDALLNFTMMLSMALASFALLHASPRTVAFVAGLFSTLTAVPWAWATFTGRLPEPQSQTKSI